MPSIQPKLCGVYLIRCGKKVYVGSSLDIKARWSKHRGYLRRNAHGNPYLQHAWNKYGEAAFTLEVAELCFEVVRTDRENYWIHKLKAANHKYGYNITPSPTHTEGVSEETRAKLRARRAARPRSNLGKKYSDEARKRMSAAQKGRIITPEARAKISSSLRALRRHVKRAPFTPEHLENMRLASLKAWARRKQKLQNEGGD